MTFQWTGPFPFIWIVFVYYFLDSRPFLLLSAFQRICFNKLYYAYFFLLNYKLISYRDVEIRDLCWILFPLTKLGHDSNYLLKTNKVSFLNFSFVKQKQLLLIQTYLPLFRSQLCINYSYVKIFPHLLWLLASV